MRRDWLRFSRRGLARLATAVASLAVVAATARAQAPAPDADSPARLIPAQDLAIYGEFDGLDAHASGWQKTVAYRVLTETSTGAMVEDLFTQIYPRLRWLDLTPPEALAVAKHVMKAGFLISENTWSQDGARRHADVIVFRNAFGNRDVRPIFARLLQNMPMPGTKSQSVVRSGHKLVTGKGRDGETFYWMVEETRKADLILISGEPDSVDRILDTMDGKTPSVLASPARAEMLKPREGFERTGFFWLDPEPVRRAAPNDVLAGQLGGLNVSRFDFAGGFRDDALMTVSRVHRAAAAAKDAPRLLAAFDRGTIPNITTGVTGFSALGLNFKAIPALIEANPALRDAYAGVVASFKQKAKVRLDEDVFGQLGPKVTAYVTPSKGGGPALSMPNLLGAMAQLGGGVPDVIPRFAILIDVANPTAFAKTLDELMGFINRQLKTTFAMPPGPGNEPPPSPPGGSRGRAGPGGPGGPPTPEFRLMLGETKSYVFTVPPELSTRFPANFRPTFRLGPKQLAIAPSAELARAAIEAKGPYTPPQEIAAALGQVPTRLDWLLVADPRETTPDLLASLPAKLQAGINIAFPTPAAAAAAATAGTNPKPPGNESRPPERGRPGMMTPGALTPGSATPGAGETPPPAAGAGGAPASPAAPSTPLVLQIDPAKLPDAAEIRRLLYPAIYTIDEEADALRFTSRAALPPIPDPALLGLLVRSIRARLNPGEAVALPAAGAAAPSGVNPTAPAAAAPAGSGADERARQPGQRPLGMPGGRPGGGRGPMAP